MRNKMKNTFVAVFTTPDQTPVFWGAFNNFPDAHTAINDFVAKNTGWSFNDFSAQELHFGVML